MVTCATLRTMATNRYRTVSEGFAADLAGRTAYDRKWKDTRPDADSQRAADENDDNNQPGCTGYSPRCGNSAGVALVDADGNGPTPVRRFLAQPIWRRGRWVGYRTTDICGTLVV